MIFSLFRRLHHSAADLTNSINTLKGLLPLQWPVGETVGLIWRMPRDPDQRASLFAKRQGLVVNEGEIAIVLQGGVSEGVLTPGTYSFDKQVTGTIDIVWMRTGRQDIKWGIGNVTTSDGINIGANGTIMVRISDGQNFNREVVQGTTTLLATELQARLMPNIQGVLRAKLSMFSALDLNAQREIFKQEVVLKLGTTLEELGLTVTEFEIAEINFPAEFKAVIARNTINQKQGEADITAAQSRSMVALMEANTAAQANLMLKSTDINLMAQMQAIGMDPVKLKMLDVLQTYAQNPTNALVANDSGRNMVFQQIAMNTLMSNPLAPENTSTSLQMPPQQVKPALPAPTGNPQAEIQAKIDQLTDRLINGEIDQNTFNQALGVLQKRLAALAGD